MEKQDMEIINGFARTALKSEDIYTFDFILCDNEVDRDLEKFSQQALEQVANMYVGVTGIFDHDSKSTNQSARIFKAQCVTDETATTSTGELYRYVKATAYMVRTAKNSDLIAEIEAGIKKEVSIGCRVDEKICSVCQKPVEKNCGHKKGKQYQGEICYHTLNRIGDAYEWSFVAVPAQRNAGVTKKCCGLSEDAVRKLYNSSSQGDEAAELLLLGHRQLDSLKREIYQSVFSSCTTRKAKVLGLALDKLTYEELQVLRQAVGKQKESDTPQVQFCTGEVHKSKQNESFKI